ncbi:MAG: hypothetical protein PHD04_01660 [Candidatus Pacebacteria bacterium]|nr:hypothetical protein [Candidatus Paceibacterota bacterium]
MTIADVREKCKGLLARIPRDVLIIAILLLTSSASFALGYQAGREERQGSGTAPSVLSPTSEVGAPTWSVGVVASKNGTKYYLPDCAGADRISDANKVWFATAAAAVSAGYAPATNCEGL